MLEKKPILISGAMKVETKYLKEHLEETNFVQIEGYSYHIGKIDHYPVIISETEIGSINSTMATTIGILNFRPIAIFNQGIAGAYDENIHKFDVVIGTACYPTNCYKTQKKKAGQGSNPLEWEMITFQSDDEQEEKKQKLTTNDNLLSLAKEVSKLYERGNMHFGIIRKWRCMEQRDRPYSMVKKKMQCALWRYGNNWRVSGSMSHENTSYGNTCYFRQ